MLEVWVEPTLARRVTALGPRPPVASASANAWRRPVPAVNEGRPVSLNELE